MSVGFVVEPGPTKPCSHRDNWDFKVHDPYLFRHCYTCGRTWIFVSLEDGMAWERVAEPEETRDVAGVGKAVLAVSAGEADRRVRKQPGKKRRTRQPMQDLPKPVELKSTTEGGEEEMGG